MIKIQAFCFNAFQENTYVLYNENKEAIIVDPGCYTRIEEKILTDFIVEHALTPTLLLNTHCHLDHVFGNNFIHDTYGLTAILHANEQIILDRLPDAAAKYGIPVEAYRGPIQYVEDQAMIAFGKDAFKVLLTPGHSPGSICFYHQKQDFILSGDLIFKDSVGRTDFPGCNPQDLIKSIRDEILPLPDTLSIYSGHGPMTELGRERKMNPYIKHLLSN
jgi:glyoxylase-like metal-dependent hydrolase (beta-lactamase superfamily II)